MDRQHEGAAAVPQMLPSVDFHCFPSTDEGFSAFVHSLVKTLPGRYTCAMLESRLQRDYPYARVSMRHPLADMGDGSTTWYVFRDGQVRR